MEGKGLPDGTELIVRPGTSPLTARVRVRDAGYGGSPIMAYAKVVIRVALGVLFVYGAYQKLETPDAVRSFAFGIRAFKLELPQHLVIVLAYVIPWAELLAGLCLIFGFFSRGAALVITLMMIGFIIGIASVLYRDIVANCSCFGKMELFCEGKMSKCHIIRNLVLASLAGFIAIVGAGPWSLDRIRARRHLPGYRLV